MMSFSTLKCMYFFPQCAHGSLEDPKSVTHHKLIHAASERVLSDTKTILEENIQDKGEGASRAEWRALLGAGAEGHTHPWCWSPCSELDLRKKTGPAKVVLFFLR